LQKTVVFNSTDLAGRFGKKVSKPMYFKRNIVAFMPLLQLFIVIVVLGTI